jgi:hypothetical protein
MAGFVLNGIELGEFTLMKVSRYKYERINRALEKRGYLDRFSPNARLKTDLKPK